MTSSPKSRFDLGARRALFLSAQKAAVYHWRKGDLGPSFLFDANTQGREYFSRYLREAPNQPMYIMVDVFEEEFRVDSIPHVFGGDREAILGRKKARLFRETPYFHCIVQGRETGGRRDDKVLMSAITNPEVLNPWLQLLDDSKVPVAGVTSVPLFSTALLKLIPDTGSNVMLVSVHSISGLRQTFIQDGQFKISRLVQLPRYGTTSYFPHIKEEVEKIRRYLNSLRLVTPDDPIDVCYLLTGELLEETRRAYREVHHHALDLNDLLQKSGSARRVSAPFADQLLMHQMLKVRPPNAYGTPHNRRYATMRSMRQSLIAGSVALLAGGLGWGGLDFIAAMDFKQRSEAALRKTQFYSARYDMARERLPKTPVESKDIQLAVDLVDTLRSHKTSPRELLQLVGGNLIRHPDVQLDSLEWVTSTNPDANLEGEGRGQSTAPAPAAAAGLDPSAPPVPVYRFYQAALLKGRLAPFDGDFRKAIETIGALAEALRAVPDVREVQVLSLPLDVSSDANLQGASGAAKADAVFELKIVLGIGHEA